MGRGLRNKLLPYVKWMALIRHKLLAPSLLLLSLCLSPLIFQVSKAEAALKATVSTSPLQVNYNEDNQDFEFFFTIHNKGKKEAKLGAILTLRGGKNKRWRGVTLPDVPAKSSIDFSFSLPASFFLRSPFKEMELKIYGSSFKTFIDKSSNYQNLTMSFFKGKKSVTLRDSESGKNQDIDFSKKALKGGRGDSIKGVGVWINGKLVTISGSYVFTKLPAPIVFALSGNKKALINFTKIQGAKSYNLYWSKRPGLSAANSTKVEGIGANHIHKNLNNGKNYYYAIVAVNAQGEGEWSDEVSVMPNPRPPKAPPVEAVSGDSKVTLTWDKEKKAEGYNLKWTTDKSKSIKEWEIIRNVEPGFEHLKLKNTVTYYYKLFAFTKGGEGRPSILASATPVQPKSADVPLAELLIGLKLGDFDQIQPTGALKLDIADSEVAAAQGLNQAKSLKAMDLAQRDQMIAMFVAQGQSDAIAGALSDQLEEEPANLNLSLSLSKVFVEQGNDAAALNVLTASLGRISLSARVALNQELKTKTTKGATTLSSQSEEAFLANEFSKLGIALLKKKKFKEALSAFQSLSTLSPEFPMIEYYLGLSRQGLQQYNQAKEHFVTQADMDIEKDNQLKNLDALAKVMPFSPEIPSIQDALARYKALPETETLEVADQTGVAANEKFLNELLKKIEKLRKDGLSDLAIIFKNPFKFKGLQPGQDIYVTFQVSNIGRKPSSEYNVNYILQNDANMNFEIKEQDRFLAMKAGEEPFVFQKKLTLPENIPAGKYRIIANVEQIETIGEWTLKNNKLSSNFDMEVSEPMPDLDMKFAQFADIQTYAGSNIDFSLKIKNTGAAKSSSYEVAYYIESERGSRKEIIPTEKFKGILSRTSAPTLNKSFSLPDLSPGKYKLVAQVKMSKGSESNTDNNSSETSLALNLAAIGMDLGLEFDGRPSKKALKAGDKVEQEFIVNNFGQNESEAFEVAYSLVDDSGTEIALDSKTALIGLGGKDDEDFEENFSIPLDIAPGQYKLKAKLLLAKGSPDHNSTNNEVTSSYSFSIGDGLSTFAGDPSLGEDRLISPDTERKIYRHLPALALTATSALFSYAERVNYAAESENYDTLMASYSTASSTGEIGTIDAKVTASKSKLSSSEQKNNVYDALFMVGVTWEAYNIFIDEDDGESVWGDSLPQGFWKHAGTGTLALVSMYQAQSAQNEADQLADDNIELEAGYQNMTSTDQFSAQAAQISENDAKIETALNRATMYDVVTLLALGLEAWWIYDDLWGAGFAAANNNLPTFAIRPTPQHLGWNATLQWRWR